MLAQHAGRSKFDSQLCIAPNAVVHASKPSSWEVEAGTSEIQGHPPILKELEVDLGFMKPYFKTNTLKPKKTKSSKNKQKLVLGYSSVGRVPASDTKPT